MSSVNLTTSPAEAVSATGTQCVSKPVVKSVILHGCSSYQTGALQAIGAEFGKKLSTDDTPMKAKPYYPINELGGISIQGFEVTGPKAKIRRWLAFMSLVGTDCMVNRGINSSWVNRPVVEALEARVVAMSEREVEAHAARFTAARRVEVC